MDDLREKVINGLQMAYTYSNVDEENTLVPQQIVIDAITLLKAQEPRVLTISELWHMEHKPVYLERKNSRLYMTEPSIVLKTERCYIPSLRESYILMRENKIHDKYWACDYNKTWRCWTARTTDEQREAVKWE